MLGFSLTKLLVTAALIIVVWHGFKWWTRMQDMQNERNRENRRARNNRSRNKYVPDDQQDDDIEEMVQAADGTWVPASQKKKHDRRG